MAAESGIAPDFRAFKRALETLGLAVSAETLEVLEQYRAGIVRWNRRVNLVSRRDETKLIPYHFLDCAEGLGYLRAEEDRRVLDLGSGAGFPGVVWKILRADLEMTLVDSVRKRTLFLESVVAGLGLERVRVVRSRAEALASQEEFAGRFDVGVARTVAPLGRLVELCMPLLRTGGRLLAFKGGSVDEELAEAKSMLEEQGGEVVGVAPARTESLRGRRTFVVVEKKEGL